MLIALDTETTGLEILHGCRPFMVTTYTEQEESRTWEFPVDPETRLPQLTPSFYRELKELFQGNTPVFYNAHFDLLALASIGVHFSFPERDLNTGNYRKICADPSLLPKRKIEITCPDFEEVQLLAHVINNKGPKGLKNLSMSLLEVMNRDEKELHSAVTEARRCARKHFPSWLLGVSPNWDHKYQKPKAAIEADYWLPAAIYAHRSQIPDFVVPAHYKRVCRVYGELDAERTMGCFIYLDQWGELTSKNGYPQLQQQYNRQKDTLPVLSYMQLCGLHLKKKNLLSLQQSFFEKSTHLKTTNDWTITKALKKDSNSASSLDLAKYLHGHHKLPVLNTTEKSEQPATDRKTLVSLYKTLTPEQRFLKAFFKRHISFTRKDDGTPNDNIGYKSYATAHGFLISYLMRSVPLNTRTLPIHERYDEPNNRRQFKTKKPLYLYPSYHQTGTTWTRFSSQNPNGQNISSSKDLPIRKAFGPPPNKAWLAIDYSQLEVRLFARAAKAVSLLESLDRGEDIHAFSASVMYGIPIEEVTPPQRRTAKSITFGYIYGMGKDTIIRNTGDPNSFTTYNERLPDVSRFMKKTIKHVDKKGWVETLYGYQLMVSPEPSYKGPNGIIQGTAGDLVKEAMKDLCSTGIVDFHKVRMIANFHDELLFEVDLSSLEKELPHKIMSCMESQGTKLGVSTPVDCAIITDNWSDKQPLASFFPEKTNAKERSTC